MLSVATAIPAFIGYTPKAEYDGKSYLNLAHKISSFAEFKAIYCYPKPTSPAIQETQYSPEYYLVQQASRPVDPDYMDINGAFYSILPDSSTIYYLYNSIELFYQNGGEEAYIVSVGTYGPPSKQPKTPGEQIVNPNVKLLELESGLATLLNEQEPAMYICPEATLLSVSENASLMKSMLGQSQLMQTAICVFDLIGGRNPDPSTYINDINVFREGVGEQGLDFGTAYYPFIGTSIMQATAINYTNLFGGDVNSLGSLLNPPANPNPNAAKVLNDIITPIGETLAITEVNKVLLVVSTTYAAIVDRVLAVANILPASSGMAGVITTIDQQIGVWKAPANTSIIGAVSLPINLSDSQQANLNVDPISGKSINAIRLFSGRGILVWGARTLDGNSQDWKYLSVRRTMIMIEQSCKLAISAYAFEGNSSNTWVAVRSTIENFLLNLWRAGGIQGPTADEGFYVACGLGTTMTAEDILNGRMIVTVGVALLRPAEFMVITIRQEMLVPS